MVLISLTTTCPFSSRTRKSTRAVPRPPMALNAATAVCWIWRVSSSLIGAGILRSAPFIPPPSRIYFSS